MRGPWGDCWRELRLKAPCSDLIGGENFGSSSPLACVECMSMMTVILCWKCLKQQLLGVDKRSVCFGQDLSLSPKPACLPYLDVVLLPGSPCAHDL